MPNLRPVLAATLACVAALAITGCDRGGEAPAIPPAEPAPGTPAERPQAEPAAPAPDTTRPPESPPAPAPGPSAEPGQSPRREPQAPAPKPSRPAPARDEEDRSPGTGAPRQEPVRDPAAREQPPTPVTTNKTIPAGTAMDVQFAEPLSSATAKVGDAFTATIVHDVTEDGVLVIPAGSRVTGTVTEAIGLKKIGGRAKLALSFDTLHLGDKRVPMSASFTQQGKNESGRDAATIGGSAAGGAILGRVLSKGDRNKGTIIGAVVGAAAGTAIAAKTKGEEVSIPAGTEMGITLDQAIEVTVRR